MAIQNSSSIFGPSLQEGPFYATPESNNFERLFEIDSPRYLLAKELCARGLVDANGVVCDALSKKQMPALDSSDHERIEQFKKQRITLKPKGDGKFGDGTLCETTLSDLLNDYMSDLPPDSIEPEFVGGIVPYLLAGYFRRVIEEEGVAITKEMGPLFEQLATLPSDADIRLHVNQAPFERLRTLKTEIDTKSLDDIRTAIRELQQEFGQTACTSSASFIRECYKEGTPAKITFLKDQLKTDISGLLYNCLQHYCYSFIQLLSAKSNQDPAWIYAHAFLKLAHPRPETNKHLIIMNLMADVGAAFSYDFLLVDQLPTKHLFTRDALRLPYGLPYGKPDRPVSEINGWQALFDRLLGIVRIDRLPLIDSFGWPMLQVYRAKGAILLGYPAEDLAKTEKTLLDKTLPVTQLQEPDVKVLGDKLLQCWKRNLHEDPDLLHALAFCACDSVTRHLGTPAAVALWNYLLPPLKLPPRYDAGMSKPGDFLDKLVDSVPTTASLLCKRYYQLATGEQIQKVATLCIKEALRQEQPEAALAALKETWCNKITAEAKAALKIEIVHYYFQKQPQKAHALLTDERIFEAITPEGLQKLEGVIQGHADQLIAHGDTKGLLLLLKTASLKERLPQVYDSLVTTLLSMKLAPTLSVELAVIALERQLDDALLTFLIVMWRPGSALPQSVIKKVTEQQEPIAARLKAKGLPARTIDFLRALELHHILISPALLSHLFWIVEVYPSPTVLHFFALALKKVTAPGDAILRILSICTPLEAVGILQEAKKQQEHPFMQAAWESLKKRVLATESASDIHEVLTAYGQYLLGLQKVSIDSSGFSDWLERESTRSLGVQLLKKYPPSTPAIWRNVFEKIGNTGKVSLKYALYSIWKEKGCEEVVTMAQNCLIESGHQDLLALIPKRHTLNPNLLHPLLKAALIAARTCQTVPDATLRAIAEFHEEQKLPVDVDLILCLLKSTSAQLLRKAIAYTMESGLIKDKRLIKAYAQFPKQVALDDPELEDLSNDISAICQLYPALFNPLQGFEFLVATPYRAIGCRVLACVLDSTTTKQEHPLVGPFLQTLSSGARVFFEHKNLPLLVPRKTLNSLVCSFVKQELKERKNLSFRFSSFEIQRDSGSDCDFSAEINSLRPIDEAKKLARWPEDPVFQREKPKTQVTEVFALLDLLFDCYRPMPGEHEDAVYEILERVFEHLLLQLIQSGKIDQFLEKWHLLLHMCTSHFFKLSPGLQVKIAEFKAHLATRDLFYYALYIDQGAKVHTKDLEKVDRLNRLFVEKALRVPCSDVAIKTDIQAIVRPAMQFLLRTDPPKYSLLSLYEEFIYYIRPDDQPAYIKHLQECVALHEQVLMSKKLPETDLKLTTKINEIYWYLTASSCTYYFIEMSTKKVKESKSRSDTTQFSGFETFFKTRIDPKHPFGCWRGLFLLDSVSSEFVKEGFHEQFISCFKSLLSHNEANPFYRPGRAFFDHLAFEKEASAMQNSHFKKMALHSHLPVIDLIQSYATPETLYGLHPALKNPIIAQIITYVANAIRREADKNTVASSWRAFLLMKNSKNLFESNNNHELFILLVKTLIAACEPHMKSPIPWHEFPHAFSIKQKYSDPTHAPHVLEEIRENEPVDQETIALLSLRGSTLVENLLELGEESFMQNDGKPITEIETLFAALTISQ